MALIAQQAGWSWDAGGRIRVILFPGLLPSHASPMPPASYLSGPVKASAAPHTK